MVRGDAIMIFSVVLTKTAVTVMTLSEGEISPCHSVQLLAIIPFGLIMVLLFLVSNPRTFLFLITK